ncbi:small integral membrane protein 13 isoform X1 [Drosophila mojavensis]|uniref:Uncharacterized protein, isoform A n=1 Tax=Drosophila mojavensis TaxID=7230 RepID=A0A0Q9XPQ1_DROMO|nr:small integral membrane protein 13 isoform X1 [Drosophila mojavensis]KRG05923.1 uncharacterized protein Dmoj_GI25572, isoform A [Drosophila mojavensis]
MQRKGVRTQAIPCDWAQIKFAAHTKILTSILQKSNNLIIYGWFLIWKAFLSKFRLVRELLGQEELEEPQLVGGEQNQNVRARKARRD